MPSLLHQLNEAGKSSAATAVASRSWELEEFPRHATPSASVSCWESTSLRRFALTDGELQLGWAAPGFDQSVVGNNGEGVGDCADSWSIDGAREYVWHDGDTADCDTASGWSDGDVLGLAADLDAGTISFGLNGAWGAPAFEGVAAAGGLYSCKP